MTAFLLFTLLIFALCAHALPALSPSIEADADYLLTTTDFMDAQFGMAVEEVQEDDDHVVVRTTGAELEFLPAAGAVHLRQRLGRQREAAVVQFPEGVLTGLSVVRRGSGAVLLSAGGGRLQMRINGDSLLMLKTEEPLRLSYRLGFAPASVRQFMADYLLLDEWGGIGSYVAAGGPGVGAMSEDGLVTYELPAGCVFWLAVAPPRPYDWEASFRDRVVWHWSMQTGYPSDAEIEQWARYGNILLQQSEVMLWKDWSLSFIPRLGLEEFQRVNRTCERLGMRNIVYTSPHYFLTGTGLENRAMNSFDNFAVTGFSPGDGRGLNWPIFLEEITRVIRDYQPDGLYFDGIYWNVVRTYLISRKAREVVGDHGLLEFHATGSPPGAGVYLPQIDTYFNFILRGEGQQDQYLNPDFLRFFVSTYNISNSIGVLCNNNDYRLDESFINTLLDNNIRLHFIPSWQYDYRLDIMEKLYWPALTDGLRERVAAASERRAARQRGLWELLTAAQRTGTEQLPLLYHEGFEGAELRANATALAAAAENTAGAPALRVDMPGGWQAHLSPRGEGVLTEENGLLKIVARANSVAFLEREMPPGAVAWQCKIRAMGDSGASWGPGLLVRMGGQIYRLGLRSDDRAQIDRRYEQLLFDGYHHNIWYWLRMRIVAEHLLWEISPDGSQWRRLGLMWVGPGATAERLAVGKVPYDGGDQDYLELGGMGTVYVDDVRVWGTPPGE